MLQPPAIASTFPRASRAIHADSLLPGLAILGLLIILLAGWLLWMLLFTIPFTVTSQSAQVTPDALVVADFPADALTQIEPGQHARFRPDSDGSVAATVAEVDTQHGRVWLLLPTDHDTHRRLHPGLAGEVSIVVRRQSPFSLILEAAGMETSP
jgi:multidrug resistance efflux pump